jgi:hexulose-6-phosphate isomerase
MVFLLATRADAGQDKGLPDSPRSPEKEPAMSAEKSPPSLDRRNVLRAVAAGGTLLAAASTDAAEPRPKADSRRASPHRFEMKKSINLWAFPYPERMSLRESLQLARDAGFDAIELNYDLENDLSPKSGTREYQAIRKMAADIGIAISGMCSFLYWPYSLTSNNAAHRARGMELAKGMIQAAHDLGTENVLVVPGAVYVPWIKDVEPVPADVCDRRAREAVGKLAPLAERLGVYLNIENIFFNGYLLSPEDMNNFVDSFHSKHVCVHFDTGNIMLFQFPQDWVRLLGKRIRNVHFKEFSKKATDHSLESFRTLLDGTTDWPTVLQALEQVGYKSYVTFEYFHPFIHYPEALIYQTSDSLDRMLGRKT